MISVRRKHLPSTFRDRKRGKEFGPNKDPHPQTVELNLREPSWKEVQDGIHVAKSASAQGPNENPYRIDKLDLKCLHHLIYLWC